MPEITIPRPLLVTVDDAGWWNGRDGSAWNQPFRTGMSRHHVPDDYRALAALSRALDMRIPASFILCEWDGASLLRKLPSATWMGDRWQAPFIDQARKEEAASVIADAAPFIEPALHGVGHEFWINGRLDRSEFHTADGRMRHPDEVKKHMEYFFRLMAQNRLDTGVRIFVPPALNHSFGSGDAGFQKIAGSFGIRYVTLIFKRTRCHAQPQYRNVGWENGVVLMDRGVSPVDWNRVAADPEFNPDHPILPLHWTNILHENPEKNMQVVNAWTIPIAEKIEENGLVPARDIAQCLTQFLNCTRSVVRKQGRDVTVQMDWIHEIPESVLTDSVFFRVKNSLQYKVKIIGSEEMAPSGPRQAAFLRVRLPASGKIVFQFLETGI